LLELINTDSTYIYIYTVYRDTVIKHNVYLSDILTSNKFQPVELDTLFAQPV